MKGGFLSFNGGKRSLLERVIFDEKRKRWGGERRTVMLRGTMLFRERWGDGRDAGGN